MASSAKWVLPQRRGLEVNEDAVKLWCFPQAGMGAWAYQSWAAKLAPHVAVLPVELPGHGSRMAEPRVTELCSLARQIVDVMSSSCQLGQPYALFGHSMGSWLAWEVLQEVARRGLPLPVHVFMSGNRAPSLHGPDNDVDSAVLHELADEEFWAAFERRYGANPVLRDPQVRAFTYGLLKDDFKMVETYKPSVPGAQTSVPMTAVGATLDNRYKPEQIAAWRDHAAGGFQELWLQGLEHNFIDKAPQQLLDAISSCLTQHTAASRP